jgi:V-type H+-transporting ATPase subunit H
VWGLHSKKEGEQREEEMSALVSELDLSFMTRSEISSHLFSTIDWSRIQSAGVFLTAENRKLIEKAQISLDIVLADSTETNALVLLYLQIADNCTFDLSVQLYIFTRIGEILGLGTAGVGSDISSRSAATSASAGAATGSGSSSSSRSGGHVNGGSGGGVGVSLYGAVHARHFTRADGSVIDGAFLRAMTNPNAFLQATSATVFAFILTSLLQSQVQSSRVPGSGSGTGQGLETLLLWVITKLKAAGKEPSLLQYVLPATQLLSSQVTTRLLLLKYGVLNAVCAVIQKLGVVGNPQCLYELCFLLWTFSLLTDSAAYACVSASLVAPSSSSSSSSSAKIASAADITAEFRACSCVKLLAELLAAGPSRKVIRMCVAALHSLAKTHDSHMFVDMFNTNCMRHVEALCSSSKIAHAAAAAAASAQSDTAAQKHQPSISTQSSDHEFELDARGLFDLLQANYRDLSTFERYQAELASGTLKKGIVHTERFWKENSRFMEANDWANLRLLLKFLEHPSAEVVGLALYDIGEFARFFPNGNGRLVVKSLGGKDAALALIQSEDEEVQRQALQCVSKLLVQSWGMLAAASTAASTSATTSAGAGR